MVVRIAWGHVVEQVTNSLFLQCTQADGLVSSEIRLHKLGYVLAGEIIEKLSGMSFEEYLRSRILSPSNLPAPL